jgi:hypothetical protein
LKLEPANDATLLQRRRRASRFAPLGDGGVPDPDLKSADIALRRAAGS